MATITSLKLTNYVPLLSTPNVTEAEYIHDKLNKFPMTNKDLLDGPLQIVTSYRGTNLYLENGAVLYRTNPLTEGGNGYVSAPKEPEECLVYYNDLWFNCLVEFQ